MTQSGTAVTARGIRRSFGERTSVDNLLTGVENLRLMADLRHLGRAAERRRVAEGMSR